MHVIVLFANVYVNVRVRLVAMFVNVRVDFHSAFAKRPAYRAYPKENQHDRNRRLHPRQDVVGNRHSQQDD
jgi:hypothetical protein